DLALRLGQRLALLGRHDGAEVVLVRHHEVEPATQDGRALLAGLGPPFRPGTVGGLDRPAGLGRAHVRNGADPVAGRRVVDADRATAVGAYPGTVDIGLLAEQGRVLQAADEIHGFLREVRLEMLTRVCAYYRCRRHHGKGPAVRQRS